MFIISYIIFWLIIDFIYVSTDNLLIKFNRLFFLKLIIYLYIVILLINMPFNGYFLIYLSFKQKLIVTL